MRNLCGAFVTTALVFGLQAATLAAEPKADLIYHGGTIGTVNELQSAAEAVAVRGGRIVAVDYRDEVMTLEGSATKVVDLGGKTMIPGLVDAHGHVFATGIQALSANLLPPPDGEGAVYTRPAVPKQAAAPSNCAASDACFRLASHTLVQSGVIDVHVHGN
jgi:N-acetylglucosamine-6-phosphate deacetylase